MVGNPPDAVNLIGRPGSTIAAWLRARSATRPWWQDASMRLIPPRCLFCGEPGDLGRVDLCGHCLEALPWLESPITGGGLGMELSNYWRSSESKKQIRTGSVSLSTIIPLRYATPVDAALRDLKFHGDLAPAKIFGALLAASAVLRGPLPDLIVPVPLHAGRLHERGYNQAGMLARAAATWLGRPCLPRLLERRRATAPQTSLAADQRRRNPAGAFGLAPDAARQLRRLQSPVRQVALVDDITTTGATLAAAATALQDFPSVSVWAVAQPSSTSFTPEGAAS